MADLLSRYGIIKVKEKEISCCNIIRVAAGTTGMMGGDTGHGGRTVIEIEDLGSTDIECEWQDRKLTMVLGGDSELITIIQALEFITTTLKKECAKGVKNG